MATIQVEVSDELVYRYGLEAIQERVQQQLSWEDLQQKALALKAALDEAGIDHDAVAREAKKRAWEKYKNTVLKAILPDA